ncbi:MAG: radical SAM family heme chaperone HemW [Deltaproteobacteria bacterium]|nr:radical SAM family heme chaperone HemW [Deltaproteobacteria bacterium]
MNKSLTPGLYVHVPFCRTKCPYCAFYSLPSPALIPRWMEALQREIQFYRGRFPLFDTLYLGGGTPTVLSHVQWSDLMETLFNAFNISPDAEITVEANPDDVTPGLMGLLHRLGVNRVSLGVQSFDDRELHTLKRRHNARGAIEALDCIRDAGFSNVGVDLMYGLPGQGEEMWLKTLGGALAFRPEHISCYQFTVEAKTPFGRMRDKGMIAPLDEEQERAFFISTSDFLREKGYVHYEISSYARGLTFTSRHNMKYWQQAPYLGFGPSAHSFDGNRRWWNLSSVCQALSRGKVPVAGHETLSKEQHRMESLLLGLRIKDGFDFRTLEKMPGHKKLLRDLERGGLVRVEAGRVMPTDEGFLVADSLPLLFSL